MLTLENKMKSTASNRKTSQKPAASIAGDLTQSPDLDMHLNHVATAAYYKAETRGFAPGHELDDWLEAEAELETQFATKH
jgi:hypothetical protein